jgi:hypothetical protein
MICLDLHAVLPALQLPVLIPDDVAHQLTQLMQKQVQHGEQPPAITPDSVEAILMPDHSVLSQGA